MSTYVIVSKIEDKDSEFKREYLRSDDIFWFSLKDVGGDAGEIDCAYTEWELIG